jgi:hypothetical protein
MEARHRKQVSMLIVLLRSLRKVETCRRDFVVLLGTEIPLSKEHQDLLTNEGMILHPTAPIIPGVPTADKLHVWRLTQYSQCVILDQDTMALRSIDEVFGGKGELTIAHHPYDHTQAQCGIPIGARGIAAMIVMRPNVATFDAMLAYLRRRFKAEQLLFSDQTGLMCFFGNKSRTLPCPFVYDVAMTSELWLPKWEHNCRRFGQQHVLRNCLADVPDGCQRWAGAHICAETIEHVQRDCSWAAAAPEVRLAHFKGNIKPWPTGACRFFRYGMPVVRPPSTADNSPRVPLEPTDRLVWNSSWPLESGGSAGRCISTRWKLPVYWARDKVDPIAPRKCCGSHVLMSARWNTILANPVVMTPQERQLSIGTDAGRIQLGSKQGHLLGLALERASLKPSKVIQRARRELRRQKRVRPTGAGAGTKVTKSRRPMRPGGLAKGEDVDDDLGPPLRLPWEDDPDAEQVRVPLSWV